MIWWSRHFQIHFIWFDVDCGQQHSKDSKEEIYVLLTYPSSLYLSANFKTLWTIKGSGNKQTYFKPTFWNTCPFRGDFSSVVKVFQSRVPSPSMSSQCRRIISDIHSDIKVSVFHYLLSKSTSCLTFSFWMIMNVALCQPSKIGDIIDPQLPMAKKQQDPMWSLFDTIWAYKQEMHIL